MTLFSTLRKSYESSPVFIQKIATALPFRLIAGRRYRETFRLAQRFEFASRDDIREYQSDQLNKILSFAVDQVPVYRKYRTCVQYHTPFEAIRFFPCVSKTEIQNNFESYIPDCIRKIPHHRATTGGSTGNQFPFLEDDTTPQRELAHIHTLWKRVGYSPDRRRITFRGLTFPKAEKGIYWQQNAIYRELRVSPMHLCEKNIEKYISVIKKFNPSYFYGYPSAISCFAGLISGLTLKETLPDLEGIFLCSEGVTEDIRGKIQSISPCRIYSHYGQSERVVLAGECEVSDNHYHALPTYGYLEILDEHGNESKEGELGEIVGTGFLNYSMPLIRYKTDDCAARLGIDCRCGRKHDTITHVIGHRGYEAFVWGKNGTKFHAATLHMGKCGEIFDHVVRYQYYQDTPGKLEIRVIPNARFTEEDKHMILREHRRKVGGELDCEVVLVDDIPLTVSGKQPRIVRATENH